MKVLTATTLSARGWVRSSNVGGQMPSTDRGALDHVDTTAERDVQFPVRTEGTP